MTDRVTGPFARQLPGFAVVSHVGRGTGRTYRTPVNAFRHDDEYVFALTYRPDVDSVRNDEAARACEIETRGRIVRLVEPRRFTDAERRQVPAPVGATLRLIDVDEFIAMRLVPE